MVRRCDPCCYLFSLVILFLGGWADSQLVARPPFKLFDSRRGFTAWTSPRFQQIPTTPDEKLIVGKFVKKRREKESKRSRVPVFRPLYQYLILNDRSAEAEEKTAGPDAKPSRPVSRTPDDYLKQRFGARYEIKRKKKSTIEGLKVQEYQLSTKTSKRYSSRPLTGVAVFFDNQGTYAGFFGFCTKNNFKNYRATFRKLGYSIRFPSSMKEPDATVTRKKKDPYDASQLRGLEYRRKIRSMMVKGWKAIDTENYIIIHHSSDRRLLRKLDRNLEVMHAHYRKLFPPKNPITAVSTVRVCKNREEYVHYGGPPTSAGFWNHRTEELVLYDNKKGEFGSRLGNKDTFIVLYHEAFHQYIYHSAGELAPHIWYNEGNADYFSGSVIPNKKEAEVKEVRAHPWRVRTIRQAVRVKKYASLRSMFKMTKAEYYRNARLMYAQGWSVVYFLRTSSVVKRNPAWNKILSTYYQVLIDEYYRLTEELDEDAEAERKVAGGKARAAATRAAFKGVDVDALEEAWKKFVLRLKEPRL